MRIGVSKLNTGGTLHMRAILKFIHALHAYLNNKVNDCRWENIIKGLLGDKYQNMMRKMRISTTKWLQVSLSIFLNWKRNQRTQVSRIGCMQTNVVGNDYDWTSAGKLSIKCIYNEFLGDKMNNCWSGSFFSFLKKLVKSQFREADEYDKGVWTLIMYCW